MAVVETADGGLLSPQALVASKALDLIGEALRAQGLSLEELIESGREERARLVEERYGVVAERETA